MENLISLTFLIIVLVLVATPMTVGITIAQTDEEPESDDNVFSSNSGLEQMTMKAQLKKGSACYWLIMV
jgi:hypothetical protein